MFLKLTNLTLWGYSLQSPLKFVQMQFLDLRDITVFCIFGRFHAVSRVKTVLCGSHILAGPLEWRLRNEKERNTHLLLYFFLSLVLILIFHACCASVKCLLARVLFFIRSPFYRNLHGHCNSFVSMSWKKSRLCVYNKTNTPNSMTHGTRRFNTVYHE